MRQQEINAQTQQDIRIMKDFWSRNHSPSDDLDAEPPKPNDASLVQLGDLNDDDLVDLVELSTESDESLQAS